MKLNIEKTKVMIFNFTKNFQFSTRLSIDGVPLEVVEVAKLLGIMITNDLSWDHNTKYLTRKAYGRMQMLHHLVKYNVPHQDLILIYILFIRSLLEQSAVVWHSGLTEENKSDLERVKKTCLKIIYREKYTNYESALKTAKLQNLDERRISLCLKFAKKCVKNANTKHIFPLRENYTEADTRFPEIYQVEHANTERYRKSPIIYMQNLLNFSKFKFSQDIATS